MPPDAPILAFDTAAAHCAAVLLSGSRVIAAAAEPMDRGQAERLIPLVEALLRDAGLGWGDLAGIGVGTGPGNFTGVRIAVAAARGIALARGLPAAGVSRFEALADGRPGSCTVVLPGRTGTLYLQTVADGAGTGAAAEVADADVPGMLAGPVLLAAGAAGRIAAPGALLRDEPPAAEAVARIAARRIAAGAVTRAGGPRPAPVYVRPPDAAPPSDPPPRIIAAAP